MNKTIKLFFSLLGILLSCFFIWNRFIRERLPRDIYVYFFSYRFYIIIFLLFSFIITIILAIKQIFSLDKKSLLDKLLSYKFIDYIYNNIIIPLKEGPEQIYELFYDSIKISFIIEPIHKFFFDYNIYNYYKYIITFFKIWRIFVVFSFILDVFYFQKFYYLYKTVYILIIPLIFNFIFFVINHHAKNLVEYLSDFVIVDFSEEENAFILEKTPKAEKELNTNTFCHFGNLYINAFYTVKTFDHLKKMTKETNNYLNIYVYTLYFIGWSFCLYFSSDFYYEIPEIKVSSGYLIILFLNVIHNISLLFSGNKISIFIYNKNISFYERLFMKTDNKHFLNFITDKIQKNVLLFYCIFNMIPKYLIVVLFMINCLVITIPYFLQISFYVSLIIFFSNLYLYLLNKYVNLKINKLESYYCFITENNYTNIYNNFPLEKHVIFENLDSNLILYQWSKLKETEAFIYFSMTTKIKFNRYMNCIYSGLILVTLFVLFIL